MAAHRRSGERRRGRDRAVGGTFKDQYVSLRDGKENSIAGRSVVVRARADDFVTAKDDGDAGAVVAYGTIRPA